MASPIWKDTFYTSSSDSLEYQITYNGSTIFSGKAYRMPNGNPIKICVNKLCQDYLYQDIDSILAGSSSQSNSRAIGTFYMTSNGSSLGSYTFLYDWDYDHNWNGGSEPLSMPVNGHYATGQLKLFTTCNGGSVTTVSTDSTHYNKLVCADYILHYCNARGGWDSFAFEGRCYQIDNFEQHYFNRVFDNTTKEFEQGKYITEIESNYRLNTGILTEEQAKIFAKHLISTNKAYLQILSTGKIIPVLVTDNNAEYKVENDEDVITYEITVKESQTKIKK